MKLDADMGLFQARELLPKLQQALKETPPRQTFTVDASGVAKITTPVIQILLAATLSFQKNSKIFRLSNPTTVVKRAFSDLGCNSLYTQMTE